MDNRAEPGKPRTDTGLTQAELGAVGGNRCVELWGLWESLVPGTRRKQGGGQQVLEEIMGEIASNLTKDTTMQIGESHTEHEETFHNHTS